MWTVWSTDVNGCTGVNGQCSGCYVGHVYKHTSPAHVLANNCINKKVVNCACRAPSGDLERKESILRVKVTKAEVMSYRMRSNQVSEVSIICVVINGIL